MILTFDITLKYPDNVIRKLICQFKISDHSLGIEKGRNYKIPRHLSFISTTYTQYRVKGYKQTKNESNTYTNNNYHTQTNKKVVSQ
jgi:hypothetical protein